VNPRLFRDVLVPGNGAATARIVDLQKGIDVGGGEEGEAGVRKMRAKKK
jgi:hypothetical protein